MFKRTVSLMLSEPHWKNGPRTSDPLVKVNSILSLTALTLLHWLARLSFCYIYPMSGRYSTNWDRKGWPCSEIKMYYGYLWTMPDLQQYPYKLCLIKYENVFKFENWFYLSCGFFFTKVTCPFLLQENMQEISELNTF